MVPTLEVFSFSATTLEVFPTSFLSPVLVLLLFSHAPFLENSENYDPIWKRLLSESSNPSRGGRVPRVSWCRGVAPLTSERRRLARGRPQAPAGEPRRRCCNTTAPPGAPTTSIGVLVQRWAAIVDATTRRCRRATIDPEQAGSRAATCRRPPRGAARRAEAGLHLTAPVDG